MSLLHAEVAKAPVLVLAVGNPSRGDDAFGPLLAQRLQSWLAQQGEATRSYIEVITDQQLVVEHVFDLQGRQVVLFIDAAAQGDTLVNLQAIAPQARPQAVSSHSSTPAQLLSLYRALLQQVPPPADLLTLTGRGFELGAALSPGAQAGMPLAWAHLQGWLKKALQHHA